MITLEKLINTLKNELDTFTVRDGSILIPVACDARGATSYYDEGYGERFIVGYDFRGKFENNSGAIVILTPDAEYGLSVVVMVGHFDDEPNDIRYANGKKYFLKNA